MATSKTVPLRLYESRIKIYRQKKQNDFFVKWSLSPGQKKKKITKKVWKSKDKPKVSTTKTYPSVIDGYTIKWYYKANKSSKTWYLSKTITTGASTHTTSHDLWTAPDNAVAIKVTVKPTAKTYKTGQSKTAKWFTVDSRSKIDWDYDEYPSTPSIDSFTIKNKTLTALVSFDIAKYVASGERYERYIFRLQILKDDKTLIKIGDDKYYDIVYTKDNPLPSTGLVKFTRTLSSVGSYKVRVAMGAYDTGYKWSEFSSWSSSVDTRPQAPTITNLEAIGNGQIRIKWTAVPNITQYKIEYVNDHARNFDSNMIQSVTVDNLTSYIISGFEVGHTVIFRVRSINESDESSPSKTESITLAVKPSPPTTWSSKTKTSLTSEIGTTDPVYLYWVHNTTDASVQQKAKLQFKIAGNVYYLTKNNTEKDEYGELVDKTTELSLWDLTVYSDESNVTSAGTIYDIFRSLGAESIKWKVCTKGAHEDYSDWSIERTIEAYEQPNLELVITDGEGNPISGNILESFPLRITGNVTPLSQTPISFHLSIIAGATSDTTDIYGDDRIIVEGSEIFSKHIDSDVLDYPLMPSDVDFVAGVPYTLNTIVYTDAGLNAKASYEFSADWAEISDEPDAVIDFNEKYRYADITPFCNYFIGYEMETESETEPETEPVVYMGTAITGTSETETIFSSSGIESATLGDMYFNNSTFEAYVCTLGGDPSTAKWLYRTTFDYSDSEGKTWYSGTTINGEEELGIYANSGIAAAVINDYYLNTASGDIFKCIKAGAPSEAIWKYIWNCFWQVTPNVTLGIYRREPNGNYITIQEGIDNAVQSSDAAITIRDPHPSFNVCAYRIVATNTETGAVGPIDIVENFPESSVVIQWDERWKDNNATEEDDEIFEGSVLELPANIKISDQNSKDVDLVSYIGRKRPVTYYGTQKGESLTINCEFPKEDESTLTLLRQLMVYSGDVYVREPSGLGYWASVSVSYNRDYSNLTIPVTLNIQPVEGGV